MTPPTSALERALAEATPLPWEWRIEAQRYPECDDVDLPATISGDGHHIAYLSERYDKNIDQVNNKDAALIVAAVNALPALLALARRTEAAEKRAGELEAALAPFAEACTISTYGDDDVIDDTLAAGKIKWANLRAARALLTPIAEGR